MKWGFNIVLFIWVLLLIINFNLNILICFIILNNGMIKILVFLIFKKKEYIKKCFNKCSSVN